MCKYHNFNGSITFEVNVDGLKYLWLIYWDDFFFLIIKIIFNLFLYLKNTEATRIHYFLLLKKYHCFFK